MHKYARIISKKKIKKKKRKSLEGNYCKIGFQVLYFKHLLSIYMCNTKSMYQLWNIDVDLSDCAISPQPQRFREKSAENQDKDFTIEEKILKQQSVVEIK